MRPATAWFAPLLVAGLLYPFAVGAAEIAPADRQSGSAFMSRESRAIQDDDAANPGMLAVLDGGSLWEKKAGTADKSCADCHGDARVSMKGVAARYPAFDASLGRPIDLDQRISLCRTEHQKAAPLAFESADLLALSTYVAHQSKGEPISIADDPQTEPFTTTGKEIFERRQGQLNLSCAQCHDDRWSKHLGGAPIPQAHPTGYPIYRLEWQAIGSLRRRLRNCLVGMRAEPYPDDALEIVDLELYLAWRARGMTVETPAVRP